MATETFAFQAEISQLMSLIVNTFYSNKEIFLRELISNSSDALDKIRYQSLSNHSVLQAEPDELFIRITPDRQNKVLSIRDSGIGMTRADLVNNVGTITMSGTRAFMEALQGNGHGADVSLIGQFGVGFYSVFLVADRVQVISKHNDNEHQYVWESSAGGTFTVTLDQKNENLGRGTEVRVFLKEDQLEFLEGKRIKEMVKRHSEFVGYPIELAVEKEILVRAAIPGEPEDEDRPTRPTTIKSRDVVFEQLNTTKPLWTRNPDDISAEEYASFYKSLTDDWCDHLAVKHFAIEGQLDFRGLLFVPTRAPLDMFTSNSWRRKKHCSVKLYVRRVFIMDDCQGLLLSEWLSFVQGVVDSEDLPLNISRETLQQHKVLKMIRKTLIKKCLEVFGEIAAQPDKDQYKRFYEEFSKNLKWGVHVEDEPSVRNKLVDLLRFYSSKSKDEMTPLKEYVARMAPNQKYIYFISGESMTAVECSPCIEVLTRQKGFEVLFMVDPIDEVVLQKVKEYDGKKLVSVTQDGLELGEETDAERVERENEERSFMQLCLRIKQVLGDKVEKVQLSRRISESPCVLVSGAYGWSSNMERIMKTQALGYSTSSSSLSSPLSYMAARKILELNPKHAIIRKLEDMVDQQQHQQQQDEGIVKELTLLMYDVALIVSGFSIEQSDRFGERVYGMIKLGLGVDGDGEPEGGSGMLGPERSESGGGIGQELGDARMEEVD
ncbi:heat shock protein 90 [Mortierella sp. AD031]|nr:heat shock protein 90 [Mortierella sp. AD031]